MWLQNQLLLQLVNMTTKRYKMPAVSEEVKKTLSFFLFFLSFFFKGSGCSSKSNDQTGCVVYIEGLKIESSDSGSLL
ncbi:hypothetical protein VTN02DRAFT_5281 [Thermoascus thermophilus]